MIHDDNVKRADRKDQEAAYFDKLGIEPAVGLKKKSS